MQPLTPQRLVANAFRTLGLSGAAGQAAVDASARRMRIWPDPKRVPATPWDLPALGPVRRARADVDQAVARLQQPVTRLEDRLAWYAGQSPPAGVAAAGEAAAARVTGLTDRHDAAVAALHRASAGGGDTGPASADRWRIALRDLTDLVRSPGYVDWLKDADDDGDFEVRLTRDEVAAAVADWPPVVAVTVAALAREALGRGDAAACKSLVAVLREGDPLARGAAAVAGLLDAAEDAVDAHCRELDGRLRDKLRTDRNDPEPFYAANLSVASDGEDYYAGSIAPALASLRLVATDDDADRVGRVSNACAEVLGLVALGWEWSGRDARADDTLADALALAGGGPAAGGLRLQRERVAPKAEAERERTRRREYVDGHGSDVSAAGVAGGIRMTSAGDALAFSGTVAAGGGATSGQPSLDSSTTPAPAPPPLPPRPPTAADTLGSRAARAWALAGFLLLVIVCFPTAIDVLKNVFESIQPTSPELNAKRRQPPPSPPLGDPSTYREPAESLLQFLERTARPSTASPPQPSSPPSATRPSPARHADNFLGETTREP